MLAAKFDYRENVTVKTEDQGPDAFKGLSIFGNSQLEGCTG